MSTPTIDKRCDAQALAYVVTRDDHLPALLTADELRAVLVENEELNQKLDSIRKSHDIVTIAFHKAERQRDQWRDLCTTFAHLRRHGDYGGSFSALDRFDKLSATITGSNERKGSEMPAEGNG